MSGDAVEVEVEVDVPGCLGRLVVEMGVEEESCRGVLIGKPCLIECAGLAECMAGVGGFSA